MAETTSTDSTAQHALHTTAISRRRSIHNSDCPNCGGSLKIIARPEPSSKGCHRRSAGDRQDPQPSGLRSRAAPQETFRAPPTLSDRVEAVQQRVFIKQKSN